MELFCLFGVIAAYLHDNAPRIFKVILLLGIIVGVLFVICLISPWILLFIPICMIISLCWVNSDSKWLDMSLEKENAPKRHYWQERIRANQKQTPSTPSETSSQTPPNPRQ